MKQYDLNSFETTFQNCFYYGGDPIITYTLVNYEQTDTEIKVSVDFVDEELISYLNEQYDKYFDKIKSKNIGVYIYGTCTFTRIIENDNVNDGENKSISGKIIKVKIDETDIQEENLTEQDIKLINETFDAFCKSHLLDELKLIAELCELKLKKEN